MHISAESASPRTGGGQVENGSVLVLLERLDRSGPRIGRAAVRLGNADGPMTAFEALLLAMRLQAAAVALLRHVPREDV